MADVVGAWLPSSISIGVGGAMETAALMETQHILPVILSELVEPPPGIPQWPIFRIICA